MKNLIAMILVTHALQWSHAETFQELADAKEMYSEKIEKATKPIMKGYVKYPERLKRKLGAKGDIDQAYAVQHEIDVISQQLEQWTNGRAKTEKKDLDDSKWRRFEPTDNGWVITLRKDGKVHTSWVGLGKGTLRKPDGNLTTMEQSSAECIQSG